MKKPVTYGDPIDSAGDFDLHVAAIADDALPVYAVINRKYGVVEHTTEVLAYAREFLKVFGSKEDGATQPSLTDDDGKIVSIKGRQLS